MKRKLPNQAEKMAFHLVTAVHDSRTSQRMIDYKSRERRFGGIKPHPEVFPMTSDEEELIARTVSEIVSEDRLEIVAFNLCRDHMHLLVICIPDDVPKIMRRIKGKTARVCNASKMCGTHTYDANKGIHPLDAQHARNAKNKPTPPLKDGSTPFWTQKYGCNPISSAEQYYNTISYIRNNRAKHRLPENPRLQELIDGFLIHSHLFSTTDF